VVQVDPIKSMLKGPGATRSKLKCDKTFSSFALKFNSRRFTQVLRNLGAFIAGYALLAALFVATTTPAAARCSVAAVTAAALLVGGRGLHSLTFSST